MQMEFSTFLPQKKKKERSKVIYVYAVCWEELSLLVTVNCLEGREKKKKAGFHADENKRETMIMDWWLGIRAHALTTTKPQTHFPHKSLLTNPPSSFFSVKLFNCPNLGWWLDINHSLSGKTRDTLTVRCFLTSFFSSSFFIKKKKLSKKLSKR